MAPFLISSVIYTNLGNEKVDVLYERISMDEITNGRQFYSMFLFRRLLYVGSIVLFFQYKYLQIFGIILSNVLILWYSLNEKPFSSKQDSNLFMFSELCVLFLCVAAPIAEALSHDKMLILGWMMLISFGFCMLVNWVLIVPVNTYQAIKVYIFKIKSVIKKLIYE